jgi:ATP-dependent DNA helicase HFM1/MER3
MMEYPQEQNFQRYKTGMNMDKCNVFKHGIRILRCIADCQQELQDAVSVRNALQLERCLNAKVWENSSNELRQIDGIGPVSVKKLMNAGVRNIMMLESLEAHQIESVLSRNPPFGTNILKSMKGIPRFEVSAQQMGVPRASPPKPWGYG